MRRKSIERGLKTLNYPVIFLLLSLIPLNIGMALREWGSAPIIGWLLHGLLLSLAVATAMHAWLSDKDDESATKRETTQPYQ